MREDIETVGAEVARCIWLLQVATAVERWESETGERHPWNPCGGDWSHTVGACPAWVTARAVKVMASTAREAKSQFGPGTDPVFDAWPTMRADWLSWAWSVANMATGDGGGDGWASNPPPDFGWRKLAADVELRCQVTRNTVHCPRPVRR